MSLNNRVYDSESVTMTIHYFNYIHFMQNYCMYVQTYTLITLVNRRDNFHYVSKCTDCRLCNYLQYVDICINNCLYHIDIVQNTKFIFISSCLICLHQCICFQYIPCYPFGSAVTCM